MLINLLRDGAAESPDQVLVAASDRRLTYAEGLARAEGFARGLRERSIDRFGCVVSHAGDMIPLFCASSAIAGEACAYSTALDDAAVDDLAERFGHDVVISDRPMTLRRARVVTLAEL